MKILVVTTKSPFPLNEGRALRTFNLLKQASKHHEISLLSFVQSPEEVEGIAEMRKICAHVDAVPLHLTGSRWHVGRDVIREVAGRAPLHAVKYRSRDMYEKMATLLATKSVDVVHLDMLHLGEYMQACGRVPVVLTEHNVESILLRRRMENAAHHLEKLYLNYQYLKLRTFEARICRRADKVVAVSDLDAREIERLAGIAGVASIPNGVDTSYFKALGEPVQPNSLIFVGGLSWFPNLDAIRYFSADVLPRVAKEIPDITLTVVGRCPDGRALRGIADNPRIRLTGLVDDVRPLISQSALYIVPLRIGGGTRLKILDALSMAKPLVSTSVGCEGLDLDSGSHLLIADGASALSDAIVRVLRDPALASKLGSAGREVVEQRFEWNVIGEQLNHVYQQCGRLRTANTFQSSG